MFKIVLTTHFPTLNMEQCLRLDVSAVLQLAACPSVMNVMRLENHGFTGSTQPRPLGV